MSRSDGLIVLREFQGQPQIVGTLSRELLATFQYDADYLGSPHVAPISTALPLQAEPFDEASTAAFFEGLVPEGSRRRDVARALRGDSASFSHLLSSLSDETVGAVLFASTRSTTWPKGYEALDEGWETRFASFPAAFSLEVGMRTRMSLAGAQDKVGLALHEGTWYLPRSGSPSSHIVKAASPAYPEETLNEALCLGCARRLGLATEDFFLIAAEGHDPLIAARRFDRLLPAHPDLVDGVPVLWRLHQEDLCQASGLSSGMKYEPTGGHYASRVAATIQERSHSASADRLAAFERLCFDYAIGNCDNHLKNRALLYDTQWEQAQLAPVYDVMCTTIYPGLYREMGVSLGNESRRIDDVEPTDILQTARVMGVFPEARNEILENIANGLETAMGEESASLEQQGFAAAPTLATRILIDVHPRLEAMRQTLASA